LSSVLTRDDIISSIQRLWSCLHRLHSKISEKLPTQDDLARCPVAIETISLSWTVHSPFLRGNYCKNGDELLSLRIRHTWSNIKWRTTSDKSDETICIATLLGLNTLQLLNTPAADRQKVLIKMLNVFPSEIIFDSGSKFTEDGLRWASKSFIDARNSMSLTEYSDLDHNHIGHIRLGGLEVEFPGFGLHAEKSPLNKFFYFIDITSTKWYRVDLRTSLGSPWTNYHESRKLFGLILKKSGVLLASNSCALVEVLRRETNPIPCKFLCTATLFPLEGHDLLVAEALFLSEPRGKEAETNFVVPGQKFNSRSKWLVG
jgi:hypothetical protein